MISYMVIYLFIPHNFVKHLLPLSSEHHTHFRFDPASCLSYFGSVCINTARTDNIVTVYAIRSLVLLCFGLLWLCHKLVPDGFMWFTLQWRHNEHHGVSNHQPYDRLLNRLFRRRSQKTSKLRVTGLCAGNSPVTGEFFHLMTSSWFTHVLQCCFLGTGATIWVPIQYKDVVLSV